MLQTVPPCHHAPAILEAACLSTVMGQKMRDAVMLALEDRKVTLKKRFSDPVDPGTELKYHISNPERTEDTKIFDFGDVFWGVESFSKMSTISSPSSLPEFSFQI